MSPDTSILLGLGSAENQRDWPDYLQYGFTEADVPDLLAMVADESLNNAPADDDAVWAPLHAWRTLGQLRSVAAVQPLIDLFDTLYEDDWALTEMDKVMGMIGEPAIDALTVYLHETHHPEFARVIAVDSLGEIARQHEPARERVLDILKRYMQAPDPAACSLNGLLVCQLMDLGATELIDDIRKLYASGCVDVSCAGDMEDVEIGLGLRRERSTPRPNYFEYDALPPVPAAGLATSFDELFKAIDEFLDRYGHDGSVLDISELDGFFAALACAPDTLLPSSWMPALWGGEEGMPAWGDMDEAQRFAGLIMTYYNAVMQAFQDDLFEPVFLERRVDGKIHTIVDEWCEGFLRGLKLWGHMAAEDMRVLEDCLPPIRLFATDAGFEALKQMTEQAVQAEQARIHPHVQRLYHHFRKQRRQPVQTFVRDTPRVGRNDPCPCGSGRKYKRCCLH